MIKARAKDAGDHYDVKMAIRGSGKEVEAEARAILKVIWSQEHGPSMIDSILKDFTDWCTEQIMEGK